PRPTCSTLFPYTTLFRSPCASSSSCRHFLRGVVFGALRGQSEVFHAVGLLPREEVHVLGDVLVDEAAPLRRASEVAVRRRGQGRDRKSTRLNSSHVAISY